MHPKCDLPAAVRTHANAVICAAADVPKGWIPASTMTLAAILNADHSTIVCVLNRAKAKQSRRVEAPQRTQSPDRKGGETTRRDRPLPDGRGSESRGLEATNDVSCTTPRSCEPCH